MHAGYRLHVAAIAVTESATVNRLHAADIGITVPRQRYFRGCRQAAWHARAPQQLVTEFLVGKLMYVANDLQCLPGTTERRRHELEQRLGEIGGNKTIGQGRTEALWVRCLCEVAVGSDTQGFLLDSPLASGHGRVATSQQGTETLLKHLIHNERFTTSPAGALYP